MDTIYTYNKLKGEIKLDFGSTSRHSSIVTNETISFSFWVAFKTRTFKKVNKDMIHRLITYLRDP